MCHDDECYGRRHYEGVIKDQEEYIYRLELAAGNKADDRILPCPFCGGPAELVQDSSSDYESHWTWQVMCKERDECWADGRAYRTRRDAIAWWNRRPKGK